MGIYIQLHVEEDGKQLNVIVSKDNRKRNEITENTSTVVADFKIPLGIISNDERYISMNTGTQNINKKLSSCRANETQGSKPNSISVDENIYNAAMNISNDERLQPENQANKPADLCIEPEEVWDSELLTPIIFHSMGDTPPRKSDPSTDTCNKFLNIHSIDDTLPTKSEPNLSINTYNKRKNASSPEYHTIYPKKRYHQPVIQRVDRTINRNKHTSRNIFEERSVHRIQSKKKEIFQYAVDSIVKAQVPTLTAKKMNVQGKSVIKLISSPLSDSRLKTSTFSQVATPSSKSIHESHPQVSQIVDYSKPERPKG